MKPARSLRVSLIAPFLLGLVSLAAFLVYYTHTSSRDAVSESARLLARAHTRHISDSMSLLFRSMSSSVEKLTTDPHIAALFSSTPEAAPEGPYLADAGEWFDILIHGNEFYRGIMVVDTKGVCIASNSRMQLGVSYANRPYVRSALRGESGISEVSIGRMTKNLSATASAPIFLDSRLEGAVVMVNDFSGLLNYQGADNDGQPLYPALLAPDGAFIAHRDSSLMAPGKRFPELYAQLAKPGSGGDVKFELEGKPYQGYAQLEPTTGWVVLSCGLESDIFRYSDSLSNMVLGMSLLALVFISTVVVRTANGVLNTLLAQIAYARKVSEGDLSLQLEETGRNDELGVLHSSLRTLVGSMREMVERSQEASKLKSQFLANMSHEIRTPLNAVIGMAHLYLADEKPGQAEAAELNEQAERVERAEQLERADKKRDYVVKIQIAARSLLGIINNILDISKIEAGMFELDHIPFSLREALNQVMIIHQENAATKGLALSLDYSPDLPDYFMGDPVRLGQVLNNLTGNAVKFTSQGSVHIRCAWDEASANPGATGEPRKIKISVRDTGLGIDRDKLNMLFKPFSQADASITRRFGGSGLGLAISHSIVSMMGGAFEVHSEPGQGTTFSFTLALQPAAQNAPGLAGAESGAEAAGQLHLEGKRVLVAEDNDINQLLMDELLAATGAEVTLVENGELAVRAAREGNFDIVLMDMQMPVMDGIQASREIRKFASYHELPIIAVTANAMKEDKELGIQAGLNDYITKPIEPDQLIMALRRWLR